MLSVPTIKKIQGSQLDVIYSGRFMAMASDCEVLVETLDKHLATDIINSVYEETKRIESKFSRYSKNNIIYKINNANNQAVKVDQETAAMLNFAFICYEMSEQLFDITSGVLRQVWHFDTSNQVPNKQDIQPLLPLIGLNKVSWQPPFIRMNKNMEIDFGGIGKEYAVDCGLKKALQITTSVPILLNFGGDLNCNGPRANDQAWHVGIESVAKHGVATKPLVILLKKGALATSGDANKYLLKDGIRYSHILNHLTGFSIESAPRSITVAAESCIEAGLLSTMAMLKGKEAESFLTEQELQFWIQR